MKVTPVKTAIFHSTQNLITFIRANLPSLVEKSILVITSKIVALSEQRFVSKKTISKEQLIAQESDWMVKTKYCYLTKKGNQILPNAGIDESNADNMYILLPKDSYAQAKRVHQVLSKQFSVNKLGVLIIDSRTLPLRRGVGGVALGYYGFKGLKSYIGKKDIFGRRLRMTTVNVADALATAAGLVMGEGAEKHPLAVIENAPVRFTNRLERHSLDINPKDDMYYPLLKDIKNI